ncbi:MAG: hypothetical protein ACOC2U_00285 [bacterium]
MQYVENLIINTLRSTGFVPVNKKMVKEIGVMESFLISIYLDKYQYFKQKNQLIDNEWFYLKHKTITNEIGISDRIIRTSKKKLIKLGIIEVKLKGAPPKEYIKINFDIIFTYLIGNEQVNEKNPNLTKPLGLNLTKPSGLNLTKPSGFNYNNNKVNNNKQILNHIPAEFSAGVIDKNKPFIPLAKKLGRIIQFKKNIKLTNSKINGWANSIRLLVEQDGVEKIRIAKALKWYRKHHSDDYVPVIESGKTLREKFLRLEAAIERDNSPKKSNSKSGYVGKDKLKYKKSKKI